MSEEIKSCPFCGNAPEFEKRNDPAFKNGMAKISCFDEACPGFVDTWHGDETPLASAIARWNGRVCGCAPVL